MANDEKSAEVFADAIQKLVEGQSEAVLPKLLVGLVVVLSGSPWWLLAEPVLSRAFARLNNKAGKDAFATLAQKYGEDEKRRLLAAEVNDKLEPTLVELFAHAEDKRQVAEGEVVEAVHQSGADLLTRFGLQLHWLEERLLTELAPTADVWRSLSPGTRSLGTRSAPKPSDLLVAAHQAVRFVGRARTLEELDAWVDGPLPAALGLVTGPGGSGKTRLAIEAAARWRARRVPAGFLIGTADAPLDGALSRSGKRVVIIDYAEGKPDLLERVLLRLARGKYPSDAHSPARARTRRVVGQSLADPRDE